MEPTATRIEITPDLLELLDQQVQILKEQGIPGITKKKVLEQLCKAGLEFQGNNPKMISGELNRDSLGVVHPMVYKTQEYIIESKSELKLMEQALKQKEVRLNAKEKHLDERETKINDMYLSAIKVREEASEIKVHSLKLNDSQSENKDQIRQLERALEQLERENKKSNREMLRILNDVQNNTKRDFFTDSVVPYLTLGFVGYDLFKKSNKPGLENIDPQLMELLQKFASLDQSKKDNMGKEILEFMNKRLASEADNADNAG